jgi:hypothetical protein
MELMTYKYNFSIELPPIEADTYEEAMIKALDMLTDMSMCFKGTKFLRNAVPTYRGCNYNRTYFSEPEHES